MFFTNILKNKPNYHILIHIISVFNDEYRWMFSHTWSNYCPMFNHNNHLSHGGNIWNDNLWNPIESRTWNNHNRDLAFALPLTTTITKSIVTVARGSLSLWRVSWLLTTTLNKLSPVGLICKVTSWCCCLITNLSCVCGSVRKYHGLPTIING